MAHNVMTAEWSRHVSYSPGLVMINIHAIDTTAENILKSKEFGLGLASEEQIGLISAAGGAHGKDVDKIGMLRELGGEFHKAKMIDVLMLRGTTLNMECKVIKHEIVGDHVMIIGEVVHFDIGHGKPLIMHGGNTLTSSESLFLENPTRRWKGSRCCEQ